MQQKWILKLMRYEFVVEYKNGFTTKAADDCQERDRKKRTH